ncbi:MAG: SPOR domain-containing protein [Hydrogenophaga sp.]|nr:SPOR domain-containing protein [Hydrogenophaga sp.]
MNTLIPQVRLQRGGTLIGFVVGLLVGLGLALAVAVYVTKVPVPFVDRGVTRKAADDAAEAERNKGWDPNAGLVTRQPPLPDPAAPGAESGSKEDATNVTNPDDAATANKSQADPLGDLMKAKAGNNAAIAAPDQSADPFIYFVQAGAFRSADDAQSQKARLAMLGMESNITEREQGGRTVFRVRMGPFAEKATAEATREQLELSGVEAALVRVQR